MGCAISKFHTRLVDLSKRASTSNGALTISAHNVHTYLSHSNPNPKCIFIFGGSGSNKGEFIWEMLQQSCENFEHNDNNAAAKLLFNMNELQLNVIKFSYHYIDVEKLIIENLDKRIKKLCINAQMVNNFVQEENHLMVDSPDFLVNRSPKRRRSTSPIEELKTQLLLYANIITNSWILSLIKKEIDDNNSGPNEKIFIINLVPNRITMFKNCLFLKQSPSFANFNFNYIAVNLVKHAGKRKDMDLRVDELFDEVNSNFINYFRLINKLIDIRVEENITKLQFKLSTSKDAIKIKNMDQLISFMYMPKKDQLELNIFEFNFDELNSVLESAKKSSLTFVINDQVDLDEGTVLKLGEKNINLLHVRKFVQLYKLPHFVLMMKRNNYLNAHSSICPIGSAHGISAAP